MADSLSSPLWHAIFAFLIPIIGMVVQMHYPNSSPLDERPANMWIFLIFLVFYCFGFGYYIQCYISTPIDTTYLKLSIKAAIISGSLAYAALISMLVPRSLEPLVFIVCLMMLFICLTYNTARQICENVASFAYNWRRGTESSNVPAINEEV